MGRLASVVRRPRVRNAAFSCLMLILLYCVIELVSLAGFALASDDPFSLARLQQARAQLASPNDAAGIATRDANSDSLLPFVHQQVVHPFVGFVMNPTKVPATNRYGFFGEPAPLRGDTGDHDTVVVAVVGGSVAAGLVRVAARPLADGLAQIDDLAGKHIRVVNFALAGMKQPQQLMVVNYFLSLGARPDIVINLDGFNEAVLPIVENYRQRTFPYYPRSWKLRLGGLADPAALRSAGRITYVDFLRRRTAHIFSVRPLRYSVTANVIWWLVDRRLARRGYRERWRLELPTTRSLLSDASYEASGPAFRYTSEDSLYVDLAAHWALCSQLLHNLSEGNGFRYFHFLQPNQYLPGGKIFTPRERAIAFPPKHGYADPAKRGLPHLVAAGRTLRANGVRYADLTMMFAENDEVLYADGCCHFNKRGYELIARRIAAVIQATWIRDSGSRASM